MKYSITHKELTCINILIKILHEAIERKCFNTVEEEKIYKTIEILTAKA